MQNLWYISQPCCSVDVYVGFCVSAVCVKAVLDLYLPVSQAAASSLQMSWVPGPRASPWQCGPARCCSFVCICSQTYWQTKNMNKKRVLSLIYCIIYPPMYSPAKTLYLWDLNHLCLSKSGLHASVNWILRLFKYHRSVLEPVLIPLGFVVLFSVPQKHVYPSQSSLLSPVQALMCTSYPEYVHKCITGYTQTASSLLYQRDLKTPKWHLFTVILQEIGFMLSLLIHSPIPLSKH